LKKAKLKALWMSILIVMAFLICWTPYNIVMMIHIFNRELSERVRTVSRNGKYKCTKFAIE